MNKGGDYGTPKAETRSHREGQWRTRNQKERREDTEALTDKDGQEGGITGSRGGRHGAEAASAASETSHIPALNLGW